MEMHDIVIKGKTRAIVCFGPMTETTGMRLGSFFQVTIDPDMVSPGGDYIRFDARRQPEPDEIHGWQRLDAITVCEVLYVEDSDSAPILIRAVKG